MPDYSTQHNNSTTSTSSSSSANDTIADEHELVGNQAIVDIIKAQNQPTGERDLNPNKNGIVYLGLNKFSAHEAQALNQANRGSGGAIAALPKEKQDHIKRNGVEYDLRNESGAASYIATLGLPDEMAIAAADFLFQAGSEARDELAQFIRILSEAEMGERKIDRMVLSGHSVGSQIWGDDNGSVRFSDFKTLAEIFPKAFEQIDHVMLSACYAGGERGMGTLREFFGGVDSIWAYHKSSPGTWTGAIDQMNIWEGATESGKDPGNVDPELARGTRKAKNISTWNIEDGYQGGERMSIASIESQLQAQENVYLAHYKGDELVTNSQAGPLREYYNILQSALSHPELPNQLRIQCEQRRDTTIRILYYSLITEKFQHHYHQQLHQDFMEAGLELPNFTQMNRKEIVDYIESVRHQLSGSAAFRLLDIGLGQLDKEIIPTSWV